MPELRKCAMCSEPVLWVSSLYPLPLDSEPTCDGTMAVIDGAVVNKQVLGETLCRIYDGQFHTQHAATCRVLHPPKGKK